MREPKNDRIHWPLVLMMFAIQMVLLIAVSIVVANHSSFATASSSDVEANRNDY
jgi:hypothetical protein